jgi:VWFA-related protein
MRSTAAPSILCLIPALLLSLPSPAAAGGAESVGEAEAPFVERLDIDVINVEAFVTDKDGKSVDDLTLADFEVYEDGKPVELTNFFQNDRLESLAGEASALAPEAGAEAAPAAPAQPDSREDQRLNLVVYVDLYHLRPANKAKVLDQLGSFVEKRLGHGDRVMTITHQRSLKMIHPFTQDFQKVRAGIAEVSKMATGGQAADSERRRVTNAIFFSTDNPAMDQQNALLAIKTFAEQQALEIGSSMTALETVLRSLGGLPGRRALLYVSDGLEKQPGLDLFQLYRDKFGGGSRAGDAAILDNPAVEVIRTDQTRIFNEVAATANTYQVTLYTLQARGAASLPHLNAQEADTSAGVGGSFTASTERMHSEQEPLIALADETGGAAIINTSNFKGAFESLSNDFNSLYSLGYRSKNGGDGRYHKIEVKVKRPGLKVRHRSGYVDNSLEKRVADRAYSSLILDLESNPLGVTVEFATPKDQGFNKYHLPLLIRVPLAQLALLPDGDKYRGKLRIFFAVQDPDGAVSQVQEIPYPVEIPAAEMDQLREKEVGYAMKLAVREGSPKIAVSVWDEIAGTETHLLRSVAVPGGEKKAAL